VRRWARESQGDTPNAPDVQPEPETVALKPEPNGTRTVSNGDARPASLLPAKPSEPDVFDAPLPEKRMPPDLAGLFRASLVDRDTYQYESPGRSALHHWKLVGAIMAVAIACALVLGVIRTPTYTAEARLVVGKSVQLNNLASIPGLSAASQDLASSYSRLVSTPAVVNNAAKRLGHKNGALGGSLSASPIALSPIVRIESGAKSSGAAVAIANAGAQALVDAVNQLNKEQTKAGEDLLAQYELVDQQLLRDSATLATLQKQGASADQLIAAQTAVDREQIQVTALADQYKAAFTPDQVNTQVIQRVGVAGATGNDRKKFLEIVLLAAAIGGFLVGTAAATLIDLRRRSHP
jgi:Chain length determinant protein